MCCLFLILRITVKSFYSSLHLADGRIIISQEARAGHNWLHCVTQTNESVMFDGCSVHVTAIVSFLFGCILTSPVVLKSEVLFGEAGLLMKRRTKQ